MSSPPPYPVLSVLSTDSYLVLTAGPHLHLHSLPALEPAASTSTLPEADQHKWLVRTTAVSKDGKWIATGCDGKELRVWEVEEGGKSIKLNSVRKILKKIAAITFNSANEIVFGDKLGDAYTYPLLPVASSTDLAARRTTFEVTGDPSLNPDGTLLLGHTSPLTSLTLTPGEGYVITSDRDEHVRVSRYPQGYVAERFLAGHTKFVSSVGLLGDGRVVSAGGDKELYVWDVKSGECAVKVPILDAVAKHIAVRGGKRRHWAPEPSATQSSSEKAVDASTSAAEAQGDEVEETVDLEADSRVAVPAGAAGGEREEDSGLAVLGLQQIGERLMFFSLGATAIFSISLPLTSSSPVISLDIGFPILAYHRLPASLSTETLLAVTFDATHPSSSTTSEPRPIGIAFVCLSPTGEMALVPSTYPLLAQLLSSPLLSIPSPSPVVDAPVAADAPKSKKRKTAPSPLEQSQWALFLPLSDLPKAPTEVPFVEVGGKQVEHEVAASRKELERRRRNGGVATRQAFFPGKGARTRRKGEAESAETEEAKVVVEAVPSTSDVVE